MTFSVVIKLVVFGKLFCVTSTLFTALCVWPGQFTIPQTTFGDLGYLERRCQRQTYCSKGSPHTRPHFKSWKVGSFKLLRGCSHGLPLAYPGLGKTGGRSKQLNNALKELFQTLLAQNISPCLQFMPSPLNQANALSCILFDKDCMLAPKAWKELENLSGPHTFNLTALDSNVKIGCSGSPLPHFTPFSMLGSHRVLLGHTADLDIMLFPSPHRILSKHLLQWDLYAFRITNSLPSVFSLDSAT